MLSIISHYGNANHNHSDSPGQGAELVRALSLYIKLADLIPGQGTHKNQPMSTEISGTTNQCFSLSLSLSFSPSLPPSLPLSLSLPLSTIIKLKNFQNQNEMLFHTLYGVCDIKDDDTKGW